MNNINETIGCVNHDCDKCKAVQEPVAWLKRHELADLQTCNHRRLGADSPLIWAPNAPDAPPPELDLVAVYTTPPAPQPVPVKTYHDGKPWPVAPVPNGPYSAPIKELWPVAPKPWVGLTDEDVKEIREQCDSIVTLHAIKAIEAKLREKNGGAA
jgi:hypothetical protein